MRGLTLYCCVLLAGAAAGPESFAQAVYRCGNVYSERPCGQGGEIELRGDARSQAQREEALNAHRRHGEMADELARDRREFEAQPVSAAGIRGRGELDEEKKSESSKPRKRSSRSSTKRSSKRPSGSLSKTTANQKPAGGEAR